jgi:prophage DNA circulation protein
VPDFWGHGSKVPSTSKSTTEESELTSDISKNTQEGSSSSTSHHTTQNLKWVPWVPKNVSESSTSTKANESTSQSNESTRSKESTSENSKQTPTEYVSEIESTEPMSYTWDDAD